MGGQSYRWAGEAEEAGPEGAPADFSFMHFIFFPFPSLSTHRSIHEHEKK